MSSFRAVIRLILFMLWTVFMVSVQLVVKMFCKGRFIFFIPYLWHKGVCRIFGIRVDVMGSPIHDRQVMYVSNHVSYLDIPVLGGLIYGQFIAKKEVETWPVFGFLSKLQNTFFVDRSGEKVEQDYKGLSDEMDQKKNLILFPEGTSSNGLELLPFKSRFLSLVLERAQNVSIQPVTILLLHADTQAKRDEYAWYGDMELAPHLWNLAKGNGVSVRVMFHEPLEIDGEITRKELTNLSYEVIAKGLNNNTVSNNLE